MQVIQKQRVANVINPYMANNVTLSERATEQEIPGGTS